MDRSKETTIRPAPMLIGTTNDGKPFPPGWLRDQDPGCPLHQMQYQPQKWPAEHYKKPARPRVVATIKLDVYDILFISLILAAGAWSLCT